MTCVRDTSVYLPHCATAHGSTSLILQRLGDSAWQCRCAVELEKEKHVRRGRPVSAEKAGLQQGHVDAGQEILSTPWQPSVRENEGDGKLQGDVIQVRVEQSGKKVSQSRGLTVFDTAVHFQDREIISIWRGYSNSSFRDNEQPLRIHC